MNATICAATARPVLVTLALFGGANAACSQSAPPGFRFDEDRAQLIVTDERGERSLGRLTHTVETLCARTHDGRTELFVTDGDGGIHHYLTDLDRLRYVRRIGVNPDTEECAVIGGSVYFLDPLTGLWRTPVEPEGDGLSTPVSLFAPWGELAPETESIAAATAGLPPAPASEAPRREIAIVTASAQTAPVRMWGDVADDPAILVHPSDPARSLVLGTDKAEGLRVYDLTGTELQFLDVGRLNNVDVAVVARGGTPRGVAVASNRAHRRADVFDIDLATGAVTLAGHWPLDLGDPYGVCVLVTDGLEALIGDTEGRVQRWAIDLGAGRVDARLVAQMRFSSQTEGCDADPAAGVVYIGEEDVGLWRVSLADGDRRELILPADGDWLTADVEGVALAERPDRRWLLVSSQGDDSIVVLELPSATPRLKFRVGLDFATGIDAVSETDGLDVATASLPGYPDGLLVVQDGRKLMPPAPQNFKLVDWRRIETLLR